jgi:acetolactate synthase-1/2/3 large subunit
MNYGDQIVTLLESEGYTTVFYVSGGNIMHILNSCRTKMRCVPVIHEMSAVIAAEYFNETSNGQRAFALVTAGPGLTNCVTGIAGAWLESRNVLVIGGQVKSSDLMLDLGVRQNGHQEINGIKIVESLCKVSVRIDRPLPLKQLSDFLSQGVSGRPGPIFFEFCLDAQASPSISSEDLVTLETLDVATVGIGEEMKAFWHLLNSSERPILLIGGGVSRDSAKKLISFAESMDMPIMTTWNGADRISSEHFLFVGRPNIWGQRSSNVILRQSDLLIAVGTRLSFYLTGFNWLEFVPDGKIVQVDVDQTELTKGHPVIELAINSDSVDFVYALEEHSKCSPKNFEEWLNFAQEVRKKLPLSESENSSHPGFLNPYEFVESLSKIVKSGEIVIPCSSGGAFTTMMQAFRQKDNQKIVTNKGLASMGYGLAGVIGAAVANRSSRAILVEGDGGFAQNCQELGTLAQIQGNVKIFLYSNEGYASIRMTQKNYFQGNYIGCDISTGLGLPNWEKLFSAYDIPCITIAEGFEKEGSFLELFESEFPAAFIVPIHSEQTYYPKISSSVDKSGQMKSDPLHMMTPPLSKLLSAEVFRYTSPSVPT